MPEIQQADREAASNWRVKYAHVNSAVGAHEYVASLDGAFAAHREAERERLVEHLKALVDKTEEAYGVVARSGYELAISDIGSNITTPPEQRAMSAEMEQLESAQLAVEGLKRLLADEEREHGNTIDARDAREEDLATIFVALGMNEAEREWTSMQNPTGIALLAIDELRKDDERTIAVSGIMLRRSGDRVIVEAEIDGRWVEVIDELHDSSFSHIVEPAGMKAKLAALVAAFGIDAGVRRESLLHRS